MKFPAFCGVVLIGFTLLLPGKGFAQGRPAARPAPAFAPRPAASTHIPVTMSHPAPARIGVAPRPGTTVSRVRLVNGVIHVTRRRIAPPVVAGMRFVDDGFSFDNVPGLGFDFPHLAATRPNTVARRHATIGSFVPFFDGGFFFPTTPVVVDDEGETASEAGEPVHAQRRRQARGEAEPPAVTQEPAAPVPIDNTQYVFVKRDGSLFFAVAYSWENGTLRYVTTQGTRASVTREALDLEATRRFNEQRGLSFSFPA
jgi:hypothetical protein